MGTPHHRSSDARGQVGIGTLAVFIAMVLVALIAGGVLIETTGLLQGKSAATSEESSSRVTDRVGVESAMASYSSGSMERIDIVLSKAPGSGEIDLSSMVVHWLGPNGSTELTESTFSITAIKGSGTVLEERSDRIELSNFGKTIPDGTPATVRFITASGGTTTVILRTPNAPPKNGAVSLLWRSPSGNPASGGGSRTATATATATATPTPTPTPTPSGPYSNLEWTYSGTSIYKIAASESALYATSGILETTIMELDAADGSVSETSQTFNEMMDGFAIDGNDRLVVINQSSSDVWRWNPTSNSTTILYEKKSDVDETKDIGMYDGDLFLSLQNNDNSGEIERRQTDGTLVWDKQTSDYAYNSLHATDSALYTALLDDTLKKRDHSGSVQWSTTVVGGGEITEIAAGSGDYVYVAYGDDVYQLYKSNGTKTSFSFQATGMYETVYNIDTDSGGYVYLDESENFTVLNPADGSVELRREFTAEVDSVAVRSDGVYVAAASGAYRVTVHNLP